MFRSLIPAACGATFALGGVEVFAQDTAEFETIEVRVLSGQSGRASIDRGANDGLLVGDRVRCTPREGLPYEGVVTRLDARTSEIELADAAITPIAGTRGEVRVPRSRLAPPTPAPSPGDVPPANDGSTSNPDAHEPWTERADGWQPGDPLLAKVHPLRPSERASRMSGRLYSIADYVRSTEDDRRDGFYRTGVSALYENPFGHAEVLHVDAELNHRNTEVPDTDDETKTRLRVDRLSYTRGGTRFEPTRVEFGRFLQYGMPEFGVLDGFEWSTRFDRGQRFGASVGFLPELTPEMKTGDDLQVAGWYRWVRDETEELSFAVGYQKTFHELAADRDLVILQTRYLPIDAWTFQTTAWLDVYTTGDTAKGSGVELTQALALFGRRWKDGDSFDLSYTHFAFPLQDRQEFLPVLAAQLADEHNDRVSLNGRKRLGDHVRVRAIVGAWTDQEENGGDAELGFDFDDAIVHDSRVSVSAFHVLGRFSRTTGARASIGRAWAAGNWSLDYELAQHHIDGFSADNNDLPQHRVRVGGEWRSDSGWSLALHGEVELWDTENALTGSFYLQKSF